MMLTAGELAQMRDDVGRVLPSSVIIQTATRVADGQGGQTLTYAPVGTVTARLASDTRRGAQGEQTIGDRNAEVTQWVVTMPHSTVVDADDRIVHNGVTYEVTEVMSWYPWEIAKRVRVMEVD